MYKCCIEINQKDDKPTGVWALYMYKCCIEIHLFYGSFGADKALHVQVLY